MRFFVLIVFIYAPFNAFSHSASIYKERPELFIHFHNAILKFCYSADLCVFETKELPPFFGSYMIVKLNGISTPSPVTRETECAVEQLAGIVIFNTVTKYLSSAEQIDLDMCMRHKSYTMICDIKVDTIDLKTWIYNKFEIQRLRSIWCSPE